MGAKGLLYSRNISKFHLGTFLRPSPTAPHDINFLLGKFNQDGPRRVWLVSSQTSSSGPSREQEALLAQSKREPTQFKCFLFMVFKRSAVSTEGFFFCFTVYHSLQKFPISKQNVTLRPWIVQFSGENVPEEFQSCQISPYIIHRTDQGPSLTYINHLTFWPTHQKELEQIQECSRSWKAAGCVKKTHTLDCTAPHLGVTSLCSSFINTKIPTSGPLIEYEHFWQTADLDLEHEQ